MKYLYGILMIILIVACDDDCDRGVSNEYKDTVNGVAIGHYGSAYEFSYKGHDYICFYYGPHRGCGIVHNPECRKCTK